MRILYRVKTLALALALIFPLAAHAATNGTTTRGALTAPPVSVNLGSTATNKEAAATGNKDAFARANHEHRIAGVLPIANGGTGVGVLSCRAAGTNGPADGGQVIRSDGNLFSCVDLPLVGGTGAVGSAVPQTASYLGAKDSGGNVAAMKLCDLSAPIRVTAGSAGTYQMIAAAAGKVYVCGMFLIADSAVSAQVKAGTGTNCGTGTTNVTGATPLPAGGGFALGLSPFALPFGGASGDALCLTTDAAANVGGWIVYTRQ